MPRKYNRSTCVAAVLLACLATTVAGRAQTKSKASQAPAAAQKSSPAQKAQENYKTVCQVCHLADGKGLTPEMNFVDGEWKHGATLKEIEGTIREGVKGTLMLPFKDKFSDQEIKELAKLVRSFDKTKKKPAAKVKK